MNTPARPYETVYRAQWICWAFATAGVLWALYRNAEPFLKAI